MGLKVALLDSSEITQKMISHSLKHLVPKIHRFDQLEDILNHIETQKPDVILADGELKKEGQAQALWIQKKAPSVPLILLYRNLTKESESFPYKIKKPIDASALRDLITKTISDLQDSPVSNFLKYPSLSVKKEDIDLDETTDHDFAPTALKESGKTQTKSIGVNKELILEVLKEYKDTLEFENIISKVLQNHGEVMVKKIVSEQGREFLEKSFHSYKETPEFSAHLQACFKDFLENQPDLKNQITASISAFVERELPKLAKQVIEAEVQKLISQVK